MMNKEAQAKESDQGEAQAAHSTCFSGFSQSRLNVLK